MQEVKRILGEKRAGALATVEEGKPRVRPFQFQFEDGGKYYFCTANSKDVCKQLKQDPFVEFTAWAEDGTTVRLRGEVRFAGGKEIEARIFGKQRSCPVDLQISGQSGLRSLLP